MTIPLGPEDINKTARTVGHVSNIGHILRGLAGGRPWGRNFTLAEIEARKEAARLDERYREYAAGEVVRIKGYADPVGPYATSDRGLYRVMIEPLDGDKSRSFYTTANNLEIVEDTRTEADVLKDAGLWRNPVTGDILRRTATVAQVMSQAGVMTAQKAHRIANAHKSVARKLGNLEQDYREAAEDWELLSKSLANLKEQTES